jgi:hypothetical protein
MKHLKLWVLVSALALANLAGCSRSRKLIDTSDAKMGAAVPVGAVQAKPSPCIKWNEGRGALSKGRRKAKAATIPTDPQKKLQAKRENQSY